MTPSINWLTEHSPITFTDPPSPTYGLLSLAQFTLSSFNSASQTEKCFFSLFFYFGLILVPTQRNVVERCTNFPPNTWCTKKLHKQRRQENQCPPKSPLFMECFLHLCRCRLTWTGDTWGTQIVCIFLCPQKFLSRQQFHSLHLPLSTKVSC